VLSAQDLDFILSPVADFLAERKTGRQGIEFTVEAGRADTVTAEKLEVLRRLGTTRVSINPQTFNASTLKQIGRNHTAEEVFSAFGLAREYGFDINTDLIAGFENETVSDFVYTLEKTLSLRPHNITVHTLCTKRGSALWEKESGFEDTKGGKESGFEDTKGGKESGLKDTKGGKESGNGTGYKSECGSADSVITGMLLRAKQMLSIAGYSPYYLYRQKNARGNFENTGFCLEGKACEYNIFTMEDNADIIACGAGAISKRRFESYYGGHNTSNEGQNTMYDRHNSQKVQENASNIKKSGLYCRIERNANFKFIEDYCTRFSEVMERKKKFFI
jgi:oxygen-independent coproporphyrinogen-3 oxidase